MENTVSIQEVVAVFKKFIAEVELEKSSNKFSPWVLSLKHADGQVAGTISYPEGVLSGDGQGEILVSLGIENTPVFKKTYSAKFREGWLSRGYVVSPEMRIILDFVKEADEPLREKMREKDAEKDQKEQRDREFKKRDEKEQVAENLRKLMR